MSPRRRIVSSFQWQASIDYREKSDKEAVFSAIAAPKPPCRHNRVRGQEQEFHVDGLHAESRFDSRQTVSDR